MAEDFGFIADQPASVDEFGFVPDQAVPRGTFSQVGIPAATLQKSRTAGFFPEESATGEDRLAAGIRSLVMAGGGPVVSGLGRLLETDQQRRVREMQEGAFAEGGLSTISAGLSDAIAKLSGAPIGGREAARTLSPEAMFAGELAGLALPAGSFAAEAKAILPLIGRGARMGGVFGAGSGVAEEIIEKDQPDLVKTLKKGGERAAYGTLLGAALPAAPAVIGKLGSKATEFFRRADNNEILAYVLNVPKSDSRATQRLVEGDFAKILPEIKSSFKEGEGTKGLLEAGHEALNKRAEIFDPLINSADPQTVARLLSPAQAESFIRTKLSSEISDPAAIDRAVEKLLPQIGDLNQSNILNKSRILNVELKNLYKSIDPSVPSEIRSAKKALRDYQSLTIRNILESEGVDPNVYSQYGMLNDVIGRIEKNYMEVAKEGLESKGGGVLKAFMSGLEGGRGGLIRGVAKALSPSETDNFNSAINRMMKRTEGEAPAFKGDVGKQAQAKLLNLQESQATQRAFEESAQTAASRAQMARRAEDVKAEELGTQATEAMQARQAEFEARAGLGAERAQMARTAEGIKGEELAFQAEAALEAGRQKLESVFSRLTDAAQRERIASKIKSGEVSEALARQREDAQLAFEQKFAGLSEKAKQSREQQNRTSKFLKDQQELEDIRIAVEKLESQEISQKQVEDMFKRLSSGAKSSREVALRREAANPPPLPIAPPPLTPLQQGISDAAILPTRPNQGRPNVRPLSDKELYDLVSKALKDQKLTDAQKRAAAEEIARKLRGPR